MGPSCTPLRPLCDKQINKVSLTASSFSQWSIPTAFSLMIIVPSVEWVRYVEGRSVPHEISTWLSLCVAWLSCILSWWLLKAEFLVHLVSLISNLNPRPLQAIKQRRHCSVWRCEFWKIPVGTLSWKQLWSVTSVCRWETRVKKASWHA